jgi:serine/threonine-protein kinase
MDIEIDPQAQTVIFRGQGQAEQHYHRGDVIGGSYQLLDLIGQGGMGVVYRVKHLILEKQFALKLLAPNQINNQNWRRFELEGRSLAKLNHTNIVSISNMGIDNGCPYFVMDLLTGISLAEQIKNSGPLSEKENLDVYLQVCAGLSCAHRNGIIHRDIKPANIMLLPSEKGMLVKIVDFGLARLQSTSGATSQALTASGEIFGSPYYMSPEQTLGEEIDARSDIYSPGCSLFESLTGQVPFAGASAIQTLMMHQQAEAPMPSRSMPSGHTFSGHVHSNGVANRKISPAFDEVVARCLQKDAKLRYQSADQLAVDLQRILDGKPIGSGALDYQHLRQNSENTKERGDDFEDDEDIDDNPANEKKQSSNFFSSHKLALGLASLASIIFVAAACFALSNKADPPKKPVILKEPTPFPLSNADDEVAFKMNDAARGFREITSEDSTKGSSAKVGEPGSETLFLVAEHAAKGQTDQSLSSIIEEAPKFSQGIKTLNGRSMRCFKFPSKTSIGKLRFQKHHVEAQGNIQVPKEEAIDLHLRSMAAQCPSVIDKFAPDDIRHLTCGKFKCGWRNHQTSKQVDKDSCPNNRRGEITDEELVNFDNVKGLDFLWLKRLSFNAETFAKLKVLKRLDTLQLEDCKQLNQILQNLPVLPNLKFLRIEAHGNDWLESESIAAMARQPNLKILELKSKSGDADDYSFSEGLSSNEKASPKLPIYDWRNQLAELKNLQVLVLQEPEWKREQIVEFLQLVPAAHQNPWAQEFGYHPQHQ